MPLTLKSDLSRAGGGYAILQVEGAAAPAALALEDRSTGLFLAPGGKWTKQPNYFDVEKIDETSVRLGPEIVDHVEADTILALHAQGEVLGVQVWPAIRPSAGAASGDVMPDRVEMAVVGAIGDSPAASPPSPPMPPAAPTPAPTELAPLPAPPPSPVRVDFKPPEPLPVTRAGPLKPVLIANGFILLILSLFAFRGTETARGLVCEPTGALYRVGVARSLVTCLDKPAVDSEETAYNEYLQCIPGQAACAQKSCGDVYLSAFANGAHAAKVRAATAASQQACDAEAEKKSAAGIFAAFNDCMRVTINVCNRSQCVDRYRQKLTDEPYASSLRQSADTSANDCRRSQEEAAYAQFNSCVAGAAACDTARCASAFTSAFPNSAYVPRVLQTAENAARTCAAEAQERQVALDLEQKKARADVICDDLAGNPSDTSKSPSSAGSRYEELRGHSAEALDACRSAMEAAPGELRFKYQYARALEINEPDKAIGIYRDLTRQNYPAAYDNLGNIYIRKRDMQTAISILKAGVKANDPDSMVTMADLVERGFVSVQNPVAVKYALLGRAAQLGHSGAQLAVAQMKAALQQQQQRALRQQEQQTIFDLFEQILPGDAR